tara:strand:+ start:1744 stop:4989 length:3246 start_codon:yes stop_codon:yes gene_type:complete
MVAPKIKAINKLTGKKGGGTYPIDEIREVVDKHIDPLERQLPEQLQRLGVYKSEGYPQPHTLGATEKSLIEDLDQFLTQLDQPDLSPERLAQAYEDLSPDRWDPRGELAPSQYIMPGKTRMILDEFRAYSSAFPKQQRMGILKQAKEIYKNSPKKLAILTALFTAMDDETTAQAEGRLISDDSSNIEHYSNAEWEDLAPPGMALDKTGTPQNIINMWDPGSKIPQEGFIGESEPSGDLPYYAKDPDESLTFGDVIGFAGRVVGGGVEDAAKGIIKTIFDLAGYSREERKKVSDALANSPTRMFPSFVYGATSTNNDVTSRLFSLDKTAVPEGGIAESFLRGMTGFILGLKGIKMAAGVGNIAAGAVADFSVFDPKDGNLATLVRTLADKIGWERVEVLAGYLDSTEGDPIEARFKMMVEGMLFGAGIAGAMVAGRATTKSGRATNVEAYEAISGQVMEMAKAVKSFWPKNVSAQKILAPLRNEMGAVGRGGRFDLSEFKTNKEGKLVGAPEGRETTRATSAMLRSIIDPLTTEGEPGRYWYEESMKAVMEAVGGDTIKAKQMAELIALSSPETPVKGNLNQAFRWLQQYKADMPLEGGRYPATMIPKAEKIFKGEDPGLGEKTGPFADALKAVLNPEGPAAEVVVDRWMYRSFYGAPLENMTPTQRKFIQNAVRSVAKDRNLEPHQAQAMIWTAIKARYEAPGVRAAVMKQAKRKGIKPKTPEFEALFYKEAMKGAKNPEQIIKAAYDYSDAMQQTVARIAAENIPSVNTKHMDGIQNAKWEDQAFYTQKIEEAMQDDNGRDIIAKEVFGMDFDGLSGPGFWEGASNPAIRKPVTGVLGAGGESADSPIMDPASEKLINLYAAIRGYYTRQDGVGWYKPYRAKNKATTTGVELNFGRPLRPKEVESMMAHLEKEKPNKNDLAWVPGENGGVILNLPDDSGNIDPKFIDWISNVKIPNLPQSKAEGFANFGNLVGNDWKGAPDGQHYLIQIKDLGGSDIFRRVQGRIAQRILEVDQVFGQKFGWKPETIQDPFTLGILKETEVAPSPSPGAGTSPTSPKTNKQSPRSPPVKGEDPSTQMEMF